MNRNFRNELPENFCSIRFWTGIPDIWRSGILLVVYHLPKKSGNFGWNVNGRLILSPRTEIFSGKRDFLKGRPKFPNRISKWKSAFHLLVFTSSGPFGLDRLWFYLPGKSRGNGTSAFHWKFPFRVLTRTILQQLSTNRFLRVNGKQPLFPDRPRFSRPMKTRNGRHPRSSGMNGDKSHSIFPTRPRFLRLSAIIPDKWKLKFVPSVTSSSVGDGFHSLAILKISGLQSPYQK